jgi:uncharacterized protein (TIGR02996 family)
VESLPEFKELGQSLMGIRYDENANQSEYNKRIATALCGVGWMSETRIIEQVGLRCDFQKNGLWVEVEFGNARVYYAAAAAAEKSFLAAIQDDPADLANWSAYADWLQEQDHFDMKRRGLVITGWLGPKAVQVKYGVPVLATAGELPG